MKSSGKAHKSEIPDMKRLLRRKERVIDSESQVIWDQLKRNEIRYIQGTARFVNANELEVDCGEKGVHLVSGQVIVIATGARPVSPAHLKVDGKLVFDSNTILDLKKVPKKMVVLGAGIIGCEYASMFSTAGTEVVLVDRRQEILASVDREIAQQLLERFEFQGMEVVLGAEATKIGRAGSSAVVHLSNGRKLKTDCVLVALGRAGNTDDLDLENVGVTVDDRGLIKVDANFRTNVTNIYAAGDVIGSPALASTSMEQGRIAVCHAFGIRNKTSSNAVKIEFQMPALFPYGIYTIPEISMIGKTEEELKKDGVDYIAGKAVYRELARGQIVGDRWGLLKLMVARKGWKILGVHIVGDNAADLIHIGQAVMAFGGDVSYFINSVFNYPTLAEAYKTAAFHAVNQILRESGGDATEAQT